MNALEVKDLTKFYRNGRGVKGISFNVGQGEICALLGPNGAGKTTVMKSITGLCRPRQGQVEIFNIDVAKDFEQAMARVGCIIDTPDVHEYLTGLKNLQLIARFYPQLPVGRIAEVLELVGLTKYAREPAAGYSLGMKKRLALAGAILHNPSLVILDEPTSGLDIEATVEIRRLITWLAREQGVSFLISSHLVHELEQCCNRVAVIHEGEMVDSNRSMSEIKEVYNTLENYYLSILNEKRKAANE